MVRKEVISNAPDKPPHRKLINLLRGWPNPALLPTELMREAANAVLTNKEIAIPAMCYGPDEGDERLRKELAKWLSDFYSHHIRDPIDASRITITGGASQNLACVLQTFTDPEFTRNIWIVAPSYFLAFRIFNDSGFGGKLRAVPEDGEGLDIEFLRREIEKSEKRAVKMGNEKPGYKVPTAWGKAYKHVIYAVPTFSNPSSKSMSLRRREEVVRLAREYDALIITDDVYDQLQWPVSPSHNTDPLLKSAIPRIVDVDRYLDGGPDPDSFGNVCSNASFSKIVGPGVRTGWCEGTPKLAYGIAQTGSSRSGGAPSQLTATFLAELLATDKLQKHDNDVLQPAYARRWRIMMDAIDKHLIPLGVTLPQVSRQTVGGYFIWLRLPPHIPASLLSRRCKDTHNLVIAEGALFEVPGDAHAATDESNKSAGTAFSHEIRLCFAWEEEAELGEGIERLAEVMRSMLDEPEGLNAKMPRKSLDVEKWDADVGSFQ